MRADVWFRLNAVGQLSMVNDCSHPKLSLNGVFLAGPLYTSKLSLQAYSSRVTAFARVEVALPTLSRHPARSFKAVIQPCCMFNAKESNGLEVPPAATLRTWV